MEEIQVQYWDVFPKSIKVSQDPAGVSVPLSLRGVPRGTVGFESANPAIASVDENGVVSLGVNVGATMIIITDITTTGYVEEMPDGAWHFKYFTDWFDQWGCNIRVQGELAITLELDRHYWMYFDVWGAIESFGAHYHDTLDLYLGDRWKRNFNPPPVIYPAWDLPYVIERRTEWVDLWEYIGRSVVVRFVWDTKDALYQMFDGWYVGNIRIVPPGGG